MKKLLVLLVLAALSSCTISVDSGGDDPLPKNGFNNIPDSIKALYYDDAATIALHQLDSVKWENQVVIDDEKIADYHNDLLTIYNYSSEFNSTFRKKGKHVHNYQTQILYRISVAVDTNKSWADNWKQGENTGITMIDYLINQYELTPSFSSIQDNYYYYKIRSDKPINYHALINKFESTGEFSFVEPYILVGGGNTLKMDESTYYRDYKFSFKWGDCPSGCINNHYWIVRISNGNVWLKDEGGQPLP